MKKSFIIVLFLLCPFAFAAKGPEYRTLKVHGMGGAFVAVADDKNALYYNPAGLNLIGRLGNFKKNPDMGYMKESSWEVNLVSTSTYLPGKNIDKILENCGMPKVGTQLGRVFSHIFTADFGYFTDTDKWTCQVYRDLIPDNAADWPDTLANNPQINKELSELYGTPLEFGEQVSVIEITTHNFGFGIYANTAVSPVVDAVIIPNFKYNNVKIDAVAQIGGAFSPVDKWSFGMGFKLAKRVQRDAFDFYALDYEAAGDSLKGEWENIDEEFNCFKCVFRGSAIGIDFGTLYQIRRDVRLGASMRNIFFSELEGESIRPNLTIGAQASPELLQSNSTWGRKINFAMDYADMLDGTITDKFFAHLNFGAEIEQVAIPHVLTIMAGTGFESGYWAWNAGFNLLYALDFRIGSYAEERGFRTGQQEQRFYVMETSIGF